MKQRIKDLAELQIGFQFRRKVDPDPESPYRVIQIKDFDENGRLIPEAIERYPVDGSPSRYILRPGDVLYLSRGLRQFAYPVTEDLADTLASGYFFILRRLKHVLPEYLAWAINQPPTQQKLHTAARQGSHMPYVSREAFEALEIDAPVLEVQEKIVKLHELSRHEQDLMRRIAARRAVLIELATRRAIHHSKMS